MDRIASPGRSSAIPYRRLLYPAAFLIIASCLFRAALADELAFVINAHGAQTTRTFNIGVVASALALYTPEDLQNSYLYQDDGRDPRGIERIFRSGKLPAHAGSPANGKWQRYPRPDSGDVPDVDLTPLNFDKNLFPGETGTTRELGYFAENVSSKPGHWAYDSGDDALLFVKRAGKIEAVKSQVAIKSYMQSYDRRPGGYDADNAPMFLFAPRYSKVKVLGKTTLAEVSAKLQEAFSDGGRNRLRLLMAACNDSSRAGKSITLSTDMSKARDISAVYP